MSEYLDKEEVLDALYELAVEQNASEYATVRWCMDVRLGIEKAMRVIEEMQGVDAEPVRYGEWIPQDETYTKFMCSGCNSKNYKGYEKYCPNCGAKMEE